MRKAWVVCIWLFENCLPTEDGSQNSLELQLPWITQFPMWKSQNHLILAKNCNFTKRATRLSDLSDLSLLLSGTANEKNLLLSENVGLGCITAHYSNNW